ncbi:ParB/RepB/Spo0J family partition protein [Candidatus Desulfovibrio trichonymphae]|uniref:Chromosome partitioning protein ParB n=1 Tax=Candidatus Desulfovibrio trichonymphae TaxID=1725232 RepID=A0A1J1E3J7_9BACT|nr:ParB/RepB/Spo0J family partition protein [Candidatus Desulfovibrio trichonymphae]BAV92483.1 chromosome partitioning protein ParB [Candidatus Desulfovibrio trichonymphae]GHU97496.1 chromosome partitioning protein ParB [Deltaproteobacteria bacterium]
MNKGLGRGLDALLAGAGAKLEENTSVKLLPITALTPNPDQPRQYFDAQALKELADSIKIQGVIQPLLVRPMPDGKTWQIVAGERRWRAAQAAGLKQVPVFVRILSGQEAMAAALIENLQREDLNPMEEARALQALRETMGLTQEETAARLGKSRPAVANALRLLQLSPQAQDDLRTARISAGHARCLLSIDNANTADAMREDIITRQLTVRETEEAVAAWHKTGRLPWKQSIGDGTVTMDKRAGSRKRKTAELRTLQNSLSTHFACCARISGDEHCGHITLNYASREELQGLLERMGVLPQNVKTSQKIMKGRQERAAPHRP